LGKRLDLSDGEWSLIGPLLPAERGRGCHLAGDNQPFFEGMIWIARTGVQWRHLPKDYVFNPGIWWIGLRMNRSGSDVQILAMYS